MLNVLWAGMMLIGVLWAAFHGNLGGMTEEILESTKEAVTLCITMLGIMSFWSGILKIGEKAGVIESISKKMQFVIRFLFPDLPKDHPAAAHISTNMIANMLGLGWAATPAGLKAMEELKNLEEKRERSKIKKSESNNLEIASDEMCTFLVINISSLQLIPMNMIAYRSQYGSNDPTAILGPVLIATTVSTLAGVIFVKIMQKSRNKNDIQ